MTKSKKYPKLHELPLGEVTFLNEPTPIDTEHVFAGECILEEKYLKAYNAYLTQLDLECLALLSGKKAPKPSKDS